MLSIEQSEIKRIPPLRCGMEMKKKAAGDDEKKLRNGNANGGLGEGAERRSGRIWA
jgi:hypothetical protein